MRTPVWLEHISAPPQPMERVSSAEWSSVDASGAASEKSLQAFLASSPGILPLEQFGSVYAPAVCIAREVRTDGGIIDLLYLSAQGRLIIGETKLHKNPESHREVIAQVLEYAAALSTWSYAKLESVWRAQATEAAKEMGLAAHVLSSLDQTSDGEELERDDYDFVREVEHTLRRGEMLGLVITDIVRDRTASLVDYVNRHAQRALQLGIVELAFFRRAGASAPMIVVPSLIEKTVIVERMYVDVRFDGGGQPLVTGAELRREAAEVVSGGRPPRLASKDALFQLVQERAGTEAGRAVQQVVAVFEELEREFADTFAIDFGGTMCGLYWKKPDGGTCRLFAVNHEAKLMFIFLYLRNADASEAADKLVALSAAFEEKTASKARTRLTSQNVDALVTTLRTAAAEVVPLLEKGAGSK